MTLGRQIIFFYKSSEIVFFYVILRKLTCCVKPIFVSAFPLKIIFTWAHEWQWMLFYQSPHQPPSQGLLFLFTPVTTLQAGVYDEASLYSPLLLTSHHHGPNSSSRYAMKILSFFYISSFEQCFNTTTAPLSNHKSSWW